MNGVPIRMVRSVGASVILMPAVEDLVPRALRWGVGRPGGRADGQGRCLAGRAGCSRARSRPSISGRVRACLSGSVGDKMTNSAAGTLHEIGTRRRFVRGGVSRPRFAGVRRVLSGWVNRFEVARVWSSEGWGAHVLGWCVPSAGLSLRRCRVPKTGRGEAPCGRRTFLCAARERGWTVRSCFAKQQIADRDRVGRAGGVRGSGPQKRSGSSARPGPGRKRSWI